MNMGQYNTLSDYYKVPQASEYANILMAKEKIDQAKLINMLGKKEIADLADYEEAKKADYIERMKLEDAMKKGLVAGPNGVMANGPQPINALTARPPVPAPRPPTFGVGLPPMANVAPTAQPRQEVPTQSTQKPDLEDPMGLTQPEKPKPPITPATPMSTVLETQPKLLDKVAPNIMPLMRGELIPATNPRTGKPLTMGEIKYMEEKQAKQLAKVKMVGDIIKGTGGLRKFEAMKYLLAKELNMPELAAIKTKDMKGTADGGLMTPIKDKDGKDTGWGVFYHVDPETDETKAVVHKLVEPVEKGIQDDHRYDRIMLAQTKGEPLSIEDKAFLKSYTTRKEMGPKAGASARIDAPYESPNTQELVETIKEGLLSGKRGPADVKQSFGAGPIAEMAIAKAMKEDPTYNPVKAQIAEKALTKITEINSRIDSYKNAIEENIKLYKVYQKKYGQNFGKLVNGAVNAFIKGVPGSGDMEALRMVIQSISQEVARVEARQLGIGAAPEGARKIWDAFHNPNMDDKDMEKVMQASLALGDSAMRANIHTENNLRTQMMGDSRKLRQGFDEEIKLDTPIEKVTSILKGDKKTAIKVKRDAVIKTYRAAGTGSDVTDDAIIKDYNAVYGKKFGEL